MWRALVGTAASATSTIEDLPDELLIASMGFLTPLDLTHAALVSRRWCALSNDRSHWARFSPDNGDKQSDAKKRYFDLMKIEAKHFKETNELWWLEDEGRFGSLAKPGPHLVKLPLLGDNGVGKTSLINTLCKKPFQSRYKSTIGVDFAMLIHPINEATTINFQWWEIAGPERFGDMSRVYFKESAAFLLLFDITRPQSWDDLRNWLPTLRRWYPENVPVFVVAAKLDLKDTEASQVPFSAVQAWCESHAGDNVAGCVEVSAKTGENLPALVDLLMRVLKPSYANGAKQVYLPGTVEWHLMIGKATRSKPLFDCAVS